MSLNSPLERPGLPRIVRSSNEALVVVRPERPSYRGLLQRPDLTRIVRYSSLATSKKSRPTTPQLRSVYARTTGGARKENISRIASRDRRGAARNKTLQVSRRLLGSSIFDCSKCMIHWLLLFFFRKRAM